MSGYTLGEIAGWLVATAVVAFALGWVLSSLRHRAKARPAQTAPVVAETAPPEEPTAQVPATPVEPVAARAAALAGDDDVPARPGGYPRSARSLENGDPPGPEWTIKGNATSMIFHGPTSRHFARTHAQVWFRSEDDARAAGFSAPGGRQRRPKAKDLEPGGKGGARKPAPAFTPGEHPRSAAPGPDGEAPGPEWTVKGNDHSKILHGPDSPSYESTRATTWFRTEEDALAAGFRKPKNQE